MSKENKVESDQTDDQSDNQDAGSKKTVEVKHTPEELTQRVVELSAENKKRREREQKLKADLDEREKRLKEIEEKNQKESGQYKELYEKAAKEKTELEDKFKKTKTSYAFKVVSGQFSTEAVKAGCINPKDLVDLAGTRGYLNDLDVDDEFNVSADSLKAVLEKCQKEMAYLFGKAAPKVNDLSPKGNSTPDGGDPAISKMTLEQKLQKLAELGHQ